MSAKKEQDRQLNEAVKKLAEDEVMAMSDEEFARHTQGVVIMLEVCQAEFQRRRMAGGHLTKMQKAT